MLVPLTVMLPSLLLLLLCLPPVIVSLPLPQSIWPVSRFGDYWGNPWRADAVAEIEQLASRLLVDPPTFTDTSTGVTYSYPIIRTVLYVNDYGTVLEDGSNDWQTLNAAYQDACSQSAQLYTQYSNSVASNSSLHPLPFNDDANVLPVLIELRFAQNGVYHINNQAGLAIPASDCRYLLINGQNSTIVTHWEASYPLGYEGFTLLYPHLYNMSTVFPRALFNTYEYVYVYNFNFMPSLACSTYGQLVKLYRDENNNNSPLGFDLQIEPSVLALTSESTAQYDWGAGRLWMQHVTADGGIENWEPPVALYVGVELGAYSDSSTYSGTNTFSSTNVTAVGNTQAEQPGGIVRFWFEDENLFGGFPYTYMAEGQYWALFRGRGMAIADGMRVYQGINTAGTGYYFPITGNNIEIIDCHQNRLPDSPFITWIEGPLGQLSGTTGTLSWWHSSYDGGVDDPIDINVQGADIIAVDFSTNSVLLRSGSLVPPNSYFAPYSSTLVPGSAYELGSYPDPLSAYALLHILTTLNTNGGSAPYNNVSTQPWANVSFVEPLPARVQVGDVAIQYNNLPDVLHIKNLNCGNHRGNCMDIKARSIVIEDSYFFNASYHGQDIGGDLYGYYEVGSVRNVTIRNNVYERNSGDISINFATRYGQAHSQC